MPGDEFAALVVATGACHSLETARGSRPFGGRHMVAGHGRSTRFVVVSWEPGLIVRGARHVALKLGEVS